MYYTYSYIDIDGIPYYIGMGTGQRAWRHCNSYDVPVPCEDCVLILRDNLTQEQAWEHERWLIAFYGRQCDGGILLNKARGGKGWGGGSPATEERKRKIGDANRGRKLTTEHKEKLRKAKLGKKQKLEVIRHRAEKIKRPISITNVETNKIHNFRSVADCAKFLNVNRETVSRWKKKPQKLLKGFKLTV